MWLEATALDAVPAQRQMREPAILRFAADSFMEDFLKLMETDPDKLRSLVAIEENWRGPIEPKEATALLEPAEPQSRFARKLTRARIVAERARESGSLLAALKNGDPRRKAPLKLYQPAHQRYYLVSACLVCEIIGLPDRTLDTARQERVGFVIRRLLPASIPGLSQDLPNVDLATWDEYAMVVSPRGAAWERIAKISGATPPIVLAGEERSPLFPVSFAEDDGRTRRLFAGLIPVGKREVYMGAPMRAPAGQPSTNGSKGPIATDPRMLLVWTQVTEPWKRLLEQAAAARQMQNPSISALSKDEPLPPEAKAASIKATREQIQVGSWYILLDLARLLQGTLFNVVQAMAGRATPTAKEKPLVDALKSATLSNNLVDDLRLKTTYQTGNVPKSLAEALLIMLGPAASDPKASPAFEERLEKVTAPYDREAADARAVWPPFIFPLADVGAPSDTTVVGPLPPAASGPQDPDKLKAALARIDNLSELIKVALPPLPDGPTPALPIGMEAPLDPRDGWFVIRCVFERPSCGPLEPAVVSAATRPFQMASFFDPDAPARPIRIALPVDTSPAGLRKFDKKAAFLISDILCGQIDRVKGLTLGDLVRSVLPWPLHKDLSIPEKGPCKDAGDPTLQAGMICSLSIPIITICALLLLMIIVSLLDIVFRWIPFFLICFPLPGFKAKKS